MKVKSQSFACFIGIALLVFGCTRPTPELTPTPAPPPAPTSTPLPTKQVFRDPVFKTAAEKKQYDEATQWCDPARFDTVDAMVQMRQNQNDFTGAVKLLTLFRESCGESFPEIYRKRAADALSRNELLAASPEARELLNNINGPDFDGKQKAKEMLFKNPEVIRLGRLVEEEDITAVEQMLAVGGRLIIDLQYTRNGKSVQSAMLLAIRKKNLPMVELLSKKGAAMIGRPGADAVSYGAMVGDAAILKFLLNQITSAELAVLSRHHRYTPLIFAAGNSRFDAIAQLLEKGADPNVRSEDGYTALTVLQLSTPKNTDAAQYDAALLKTIDLLVHKGGNPDARSGEKQYTLLHTAVTIEKPSLVRHLLELKVNTEARDSEGKTPLLLAVKKGNTEIFDLLIKGGADIDAKEQTGQTILMYAVYEGRKELVERLLKAGADVNVRDDDNSTALSFAGKKADVEIARLLLQAGADVNAVDGDGDIPANRILCSYQVQKQKKQVEFINLLAAFQANLGYTGGNWGSPLHCIAETGDEKAMAALTDWRKKTQAPPFKINAVDYKNETPLFKAATEGKTEMVARLIELGADVHHKNKYGRTALFDAAWRDFEGIIFRLVKKGADLNAADRKGKTPLMYTNRKKTIQQLIKYGADVHRRDKSGKSALWWMANDGEARAITELIKHGANVNRPDDKGVTPLMAAAAVTNSTVEALIRQGADPTIKDERGRSPMIWSIYDPGYYPLLEERHQTLRDAFLKFRPQCRQFSQKSHEDFMKMPSGDIRNNFKNCLDALPPDQQVAFLAAALKKSAKDKKACTRYARYLENFSIPETLKDQDSSGENTGFWEVAKFEAAKAAAQCLERPFDQIAESHNCPIKGLEYTTRLHPIGESEGTVQCVGVIRRDKEEAKQRCPDFVRISQAGTGEPIQIETVTLPDSKLSDPVWCRNYRNADVKHGVDRTTIKFYIEQARSYGEKQQGKVIHEVYDWNSGTPEKLLDKTTDYQFRFSM